MAGVFRLGMESCIDGEKHYFHNSWGSLHDNGFCGLCNCTRSVTPHELSEALKNNECGAEPTLIQLLEESSNPNNFKPRRFR